MEWTFDPLEIKNAYFNLERLGAIARRYNINQYGITTSPLQGFLPTDRLVAEWWLKSKRVRIIACRKANIGRFQGGSCASRFRPKSTRGRPSRRTRQKAADVQLRNREQFLKAFSRRAVVSAATAVTRMATECFVLGRWDEDWSYAS